MLTNKSKSGFSLLEILLASVIFIISIGGIFVTLSAVRRPVSDKENALAATVFGKQVLEALRSQVSASANYYTDTSCTGSGSSAICTDFSLFLGTHQVPLANQPSNIQSAWPSTITNSNNVCAASSCLVYTVTCGDSPTDYTNCAQTGTNPDMARQVILSINWPTTI